jgi:chromosome partitioning protein
MKTVAILSGKGGSGKSTIALHLAVSAERRGYSVAVLDIDPQASAATWADSRSSETPSVTSLQPSRIAKAIETAREAGAALALIDTAPHSADAAMIAAEAADLVLVPCRPGILDLRAIGSTARILKLAAKPAFVVLNAAPPHAPRLIDDARAAVATHGLEVAPVVIAQRAAFAHSLTVGQTAEEYEPGGKAAEEIAALFAWLLNVLAVKGPLHV